MASHNCSEFEHFTINVIELRPHSQVLSSLPMILLLLKGLFRPFPLTIAASVSIIIDNIIALGSHSQQQAWCFVGSLSWAVPLQLGARTLATLRTSSSKTAP